MLKLFCQGKDETAIVQQITEIYEAPLEQVSKDVTAFAKKLKEKNLL